jgi:N-methylhydantoinase B/oxoprolinase/acetone carboxylase alpha subunit
VQINERSIDTRRLHVLNKGDLLLVRTPGAGGYGDVRERSAEHLARDRLAGWNQPPARQ